MSHRGYKKSAPSDDDETNMTPVPNFTSEISADSGEIKSGDVKCVSRILGDGEEVPEGSFGSFIPQNFLTEEQLLEFRGSEEFKAMQKISGRRSQFQAIRELRNNNIHPENINIADIQLLQKYLGIDGNFDPSNQELFDGINTVLEDLSNFKGRFGLP